MDESIFPVAPYLTHGWFKVGSHPTIKYEHKRDERHNVMAAMNSRNFVYHFSDENFNSQTFKVFLVNLILIFRKVVIVGDNAKYHTSNEMQEFYKENESCLHAIFFPSYSPELDPLETGWRETKKRIATRCWKNKDELKEELRLAFNEGIPMVPIYDYLLP